MQQIAKALSKGFGNTLADTPCACLCRKLQGPASPLAPEGGTRLEGSAMAQGPG